MQQHHQQPYQQPYQHNPYAQSQAPGYGPPQGPQGSTKDLDDQSLIWLLVGCGGFFFALSWITGPLAWIFGSKLRKQYMARGLEPNGMATAAWIVGIVSTALYGFALLALLVMFSMMFLALGAVAAGA